MDARRAGQGQGAPERPIQSGPEIYGALLERIASSQRRPFYAQATVMEVHEASNERAPRERYPDLFRDREDRESLQALRLASRDPDDFIRTLSALPGGERTLFLITSDHGEGLSDHPHVGGSLRHGLLLYKSQLRVPLIHAGEQAVDLPEAFFAETRFRHQNKIAVYTNEWKYIENRDHHRGSRPRALHRVGLTEDGWRTELARSYPSVVNRLGSRLRESEGAHPTAPPTPRRTPLSEAELEQLRALGYAQ